jgi:hypothetical protein
MQASCSHPGEEVSLPDAARRLGPTRHPAQASAVQAALGCGAIRYSSGMRRHSVGRIAWSPSSFLPAVPSSVNVASQWPFTRQCRRAARFCCSSLGALLLCFALTDACTYIIAAAAAAAAGGHREIENRERKELDLPFRHFKPLGVVAFPAQRSLAAPPRGG